MARLTDIQHVSIEVARERALAHLRGCHLLELEKANCVALAIWPDHRMTSQGAGAAASRILKLLQRDGLVEWTARNGDWGYKLTAAGRVIQSSANG